MSNDVMTARTTMEAAAEDVFAVLADPSSHAAIDGTGWVREPLDAAPLTARGQIFEMAMYFNRPPDGHYRVANRVIAFEPPRAIAWEPGQRTGEQLEFGGWTWRYDLEPLGPSRTEVTLTYDWSAVAAEVRREIAFPPFGPEHLENSLHHLAALAELSRSGPPAR
ncbi:activator of HSP90 ATPase [Mycolicibacterium litorale]|uniref:Activator of HSP90 ATPase n=1 Tax=Mycolicibacterium litorale TaxID=758802 RepID=A0A6S6P0Q2_9MYCO|nr:SRPBCC family protein [Mycolicibacterium litorale]BCI52344.1 activator of HSP90 ATPase [Mycolicibacterium litorale]